MSTRGETLAGLGCAAVAGVVTMLVCGCVSNPEPAIGCNAAPVVYDRDDREEAWQAEAPFRALAQGFVVAVIDRFIVDSLASGQLSLADLGAKNVLQLCPDERFADQPSVAACSGVLLAPDLVLTAAHCVDDEDDCEKLLFVSDVANRSDGPWVGVLPSQQRSCTSIARVASDVPTIGTGRDVALVRLDAPLYPPSDFFPIRSEPPRVGERVVAIGHPSGVPLKFDAGGRIRSVAFGAIDYATTDTDTFAGSSGGPVFDANAALLGIVLGGRSDYVYDSAADCLRAIHVSTAIDAARAERIAPIAGALQRLCASGADVACALLQSATARAPEDVAACPSD